MGSYINEPFSVIMMRMEVPSLVNCINGSRIMDLINALPEKGLNFSIAPRRIPVEDIICSFKDSIEHLPENEAEEVRQNYARTLRRAKPPKPNITNEEYKALKELRKNGQIVILKADKGGATVILNKEDYVSKMESHLDLSGCYKNIDKNALSRITREVAETIKRSYIDDDIKKKNPYFGSLDSKNLRTP